MIISIRLSISVKSNGFKGGPAAYCKNENDDILLYRPKPIGHTYLIQLYIPKLNDIRVYIFLRAVHIFS